MIEFFLKYTFCKIGFHSWREFQDKFRTGDFYCKNCRKYMTDEDIYGY